MSKMKEFIISSEHISQTPELPSVLYIQNANESEKNKKPVLRAA